MKKNVIFGYSGSFHCNSWIHFRSLTVSFLVLVGCLGFGLTSQSASYSAAQLNTAQDGSVDVIPLEATVQASPTPKIIIKTYAPGTFTISRKDPSSNSWGTPIATGVTLAANGTWTDSTVSVGTLYEYQFVNTAGTSYVNYIIPIYPAGYILTGINVDQTQSKGRMAVVVASDVPSTLPTEYASYKNDLVADGWTVHEIQVPRAANYNGIGNGAIATVTVNAGGSGSMSSGTLSGGVVYLGNSSGQKAAALLTASSGVIQSATIYPQGGGRNFSVNDLLTVYGGYTSGSGASLQVASVREGFPLTTMLEANFVLGGTNYTAAQVTLTGAQSKVAVTGTIFLQAGGSGIDHIHIASVPSQWTLWEQLIMSGPGNTGTGALILYARSQDIYIYTAGLGYVNGDTATLTGNKSGKTVQVQLVTDFIGSGGMPFPLGTITGLKLPSNPTYPSGFTGGETFTLTTTTSSSGSGAAPIAVSFNSAMGTVSVVNGGTNYVNGNQVRLDTNGATGILNVTSGSITSVTVTNSGTGNYSQNDLLHDFPVSASDLLSTATGYNLTVATLDNTGAGKGINVTAGGSGYHDNDSVTLRGVTSGATAAGSIIAQSGSITGISAVLPNTFNAGETVTVTAASGGSGATAISGSQTEYHLLIRSAIQALYNAYNTDPLPIKNVAMVGKVPVCRSGLFDGNSTDGHGNETSYGADAFYADMDGVIGPGGWTDVGIGMNGNLNAAGTFQLSNYNFPGDLQFDQNRISQVGNGQVELGFGRIDLSLAIQNDLEALRTYFNKLHLYKTADSSFRPGRKVCDRNETLVNPHETALQSMPGVVGMSNIEFYVLGDMPNAPTNLDADQLFSAQHGPYLFYFKGSGGPQEGAGGRAVFWTGFQSHWGFWYNMGLASSGANGMQRNLGENSYTLSWTWDAWGLRYLYHRMGMGLDAGDMMKQSINNQGWLFGPYTYRYGWSATGIAQTKTTGGDTVNANNNNGDFHGSLFMNHMGDPALRLFMFQPPSALSVTSSGNNPILTWTAPPAATLPEISATTYHVYRAATAAGPFTRLTSTPQTGTTYKDSSVTSGSYTYMVRGVRLETTGGGTYYNASLGITQSINLAATPPAVSITTGSLSNLNWNGSYSIALSATGGVPVYTWALAQGSGPLPQGLSLSPTGVISGSTTQYGVYNFTVQATDHGNPQQTVTQSLSLTVNSDNGQVIYPEATSYTNGANSYTQTIPYGGGELNWIGGGSLYETFQRYDLSSVAKYNGIIKATLYLYPTSASDPTAFGLLQANLIADSQDAWVDNSIIQPITSYANNGSGQVRITGTAHGFTTGNLVTVTGVAGTGIPVSGSSYAITVTGSNTFDLPIPYVAGWTFTSAKATTVGVVYNNRPTLYNSNVTTVTATATPVASTPLQLDVTSFVNQKLNNSSSRKMSVRLFSNSTATLEIGSLYAFGGAIPYLVIETADAPNIVVTSPTVNPAFIPTGTGILLSASVTSFTGSATLQWAKVSGPGTVTFTNPTSTLTGASFSVAGDYVVSLTAFDGVAQSSKNIAISIRSSNAAVTGPIDSLVLRLPLDEGKGTNAIDYSGVSPANSGTLSVGAGWSATGKIGGALSVTGSNYLVIPDSSTHPLDGGTAVSISAWINLSTIDPTKSDFHAIVSKSSYMLNTRGSGSPSIPSIVSTIFFGVNGIGTYSVTSIYPSQWYHLVMVFDGSLPSNNLKLYVNGAPDRFATISQTTVPRSSSSPFYVGALGSADTLGFNGLIDEVRVYNRALSPTEVLNLYNAVPADMGPVITTSPILTGSVGQALPLTATVSSSSSTLSYSWSELSGPIQLTISGSTTLSASTTPSISGSFSLSFAANDSAITTFATIAANITGGTYANWVTQNSLTGNNALLTTVLAKDGLNNLFKYALGLNPTTHYNAGSAGIPSVAIQNNYLRLTFNGVANDVTYTVQASSDLATWTTIQTFPSGGTAPGLQTVQDSQPMSAYTKRFMRLLILK